MPLFGLGDMSSARETGGDLVIEYHGDRLVPPELCRLLYRLVPKDHHVPVRFHNRRRKDVHGEMKRLPLGTCYFKHRRRPSHIDINLNPIYKASWYRHYPYTWSPSAFVWRMLLEVCLHEFGHVATSDTALKMNQHEYHGEYGRVYEATERLADEWMERRLSRYLADDPRMGQPRYITGYLGARLLEVRSHAEGKRSGRLYSAYIKETRCRKTGAQLSAGNVLMELKVDPCYYTNAYEVLRRASKDVGIDYTDGAGRRHKLYTWGDVSILARRLEERAKELVPRDDTFVPRTYVPGIDGDSEGDLHSSRVIFSEEVDEADFPDPGLPF